MASPPFLMEDNDADFFDKLVEDDDDFSVSEAAGASYVDGADSDEVKAFSNLSLSEVGTVPEEDEVGDSSTKEEKHSTEDLIVSSSSDVHEKENSVLEGSAPLVSSNSLASDSVVESNNAGADISLDSSMDKSNESKTTSVKEIGWSSFHAGSDKNGGTGFGSYSDFFTELGDSSVDPFSNVGDAPKADSYTTSGITNNEVLDTTTSFGSTLHEDMPAHAAAIEQTTNGQDVYNSQYWENLYPGWRYDPNSGEWHQVEGYGTAENTMGTYDYTTQTINDVSNQSSEVSYLQQTTQSVMGTVSEACTTGSIANWNQVPQGNIEYPAHMVFDPQYPGWYYDTITQEWRLLESYTPVVESISTAPNQNVQDERVSSGGFLSNKKDHSLYNEYGQVEMFGTQGLGTQGQTFEWADNHAPSNTNKWQPTTIADNHAPSNINRWQPTTIADNHAPSNTNRWQPTTIADNHAPSNTIMWQPTTIAESDAVSGFVENHNSENPYGSRGPVSNFVDKHTGFQPMGITSYEHKGQSYGGNKGVTEFQGFVPTDSFSQHHTQPKAEQNQQLPFSHDYYGSQKSGTHSHQPFQTVTQSSYTPIEGRSADGRPAHAWVTFGFGGKLIVVKNSGSLVASTMYGGKDCVGGSVSVLDLMDVVMDKNDARNTGLGPCDYFRPLCQQSFPGPLVGGNVGNKELFKWIDERITNCGSPSMNYRNGELLRLLLSLLKIACQHYGKLRSPYGTGQSLKENDRPESAVAKLFASAKKSGDQMTGYATHPDCLKNIPSEGQIRATAAEVQNLLVAGRANEALQCAQGGQLWGPALILAAQLGDQFYVDTVKQMAHCQLVAGSPLRTLCLLIAGQPADVFSADTTVNSGLPGAVNMPQQQAQIGANVMLDDWEENLAIITANRTKGDELVVLHLGDCLWKERGEITAAHICYLVAEANFESFSDIARLCLIGSDHWRFPRTYASPEAIQRTELYEYSTVLGNSQSILLPFQPYKIIYAHMLAEVGKLSESLKYCNAILKSLKTVRAPEVDSWKQLVSSLEERIRTHQQGGFGTNLAPLIGSIIGSIDRSIHRMIGPPPAPMMSAQNNEFDNHSMGQKGAGSQSTMAMSSLMPSASMERISEWTGESNNKRSVPNRSVSEPDFGKSPRQGSSKDAASSDAHNKTSVAGGPSRFGRIGSQFIQKTMGWVSKSRQAKLGEENKFYYCEKRKQWVEKGAEPPVEQMSLPPPPPKTSALQNGMSDYNIKNAFSSGENLAANGVNETRSPTSIERSSGIPPLPPSSNQFSSRRMGVRARYVDTFNKGGGTSAKLFQSPSVPVAKPGGPANTKFFVPAPMPSGEQTLPATGENMEEHTAASEDLSTVMTKDSSFSSQPPLSSSSSMARYASMSNISPTGTNRTGVQENGNDSLSRRTASWSGSLNDAFAPPKLMNHMKPLEEVSETPPSSSSLPNDFSSSMHLPKSSSFGEDLQEVEL